MESITEPQSAEKHIVDQILSGRARIQTELAKVIIGQNDVIERLLIALFAGGHCLITGAPGLAKTLLVKSIAQIFHLKFQRVQFTPDLMPADITGTEILQESGEGRRMTFVPGPVFANMILADDINPTPPTTQAALPQAMQEHQATAAGAHASAPVNSSSWAPKSARCCTAAPTSRSKTFKPSHNPPCATAFCSTTARRPKGSPSRMLWSVC